MENKRNFGLFTLCSDNMIEICLTMLYSFLMNNKWFYDIGEINVLCDNNICKLNDKNRNKILKLYKNTIFRNVNYEFYEPLIEHQEKVLLTPECFKPVTYKYELFKDYGYEKHVFLDSDMIVTNDISELFFNGIIFGACLDMSCIFKGLENNIMLNFSSENPNVYFNSGMMVIGKNFMNENIFTTIYNFNLNLTPEYNFKKILSWKGKLVEQDNLNEVIKNYNILPYKIYNHSHFLVDVNNYKSTKIIHYCGGLKPWNTVNNNYEIAHMLFYKYDFLRKNNLKF